MGYTCVVFNVQCAWLQVVWLPWQQQVMATLGPSSPATVLDESSASSSSSSDSDSSSDSSGDVNALGQQVARALPAPPVEVVIAGKCRSQPFEVAVSQAFNDGNVSAAPSEENISITATGKCEINAHLTRAQNPALAPAPPHSMLRSVAGRPSVRDKKSPIHALARWSAFQH